MPKPSFFLRTKLIPPRVVAELLSRPRLTKKLESNINSPITMVAADAGFGKTTLIADFIKNQSRDSVWYQLDHTDADPFVFLGYLTKGIKMFQPDFGETILPYLNEATDDLLLHPEHAVDLLINEILENVEQPFVLVLDDYHHIGRETVVHKLVDRLIQYSAELLHLIITTRDLPPLAIMRRKTQSRALIINREDLLFTDEEVRELFRTTLNLELKDREISQYRERTHGWITALQLVRQVAEQKIYSGTENLSIDLSEMLHQSEKDIFDYFAEEVFSREDEETQNLLLRLSLLETLPLDVCSRLFPEFRCSAILPELLQKNVFLTVTDDGNRTEEYRLHPLFRDFLQRRLRSDKGLKGINEERNRIADFFIENDQWDKSMPFLLDSENYEKASEFISKNGAEWISGGAILTLHKYTEKIPFEILEKYPTALLHKAEIARLQGFYDKSTKILNRAVKLLHKKKDAAGEAEALHSLASLARRKSKFEEAFKLLKEAEKLIDENSETYFKCANTHGLCLIAGGDWTGAEQQFRYGLELAEKAGNENYIRIITHNLALPPGYRGDYAEALRWFKRIFREDQPDKQLPQEAIGHLNIGRLHLYRGEFEKSQKHLDKSLELCQLYNLKYLRGEIFETFGNYYRDIRDFQHAGEFYERASKAYIDAGINIQNRELDSERAKFYAMRGNFDKARGIYENLIELYEKNDNRVALNLTKLFLLQLRFEEGNLKNIEKQLHELVDFFRKKQFYFDETHTSLLLAQIYFSKEDRKKMKVHLQRALDLTVRFDYEHWLKEQMHNNPKFFKDEDILEKLPLDLRENIGKEKTKQKVSSISISQEVEFVTDLTVKLLGPIEIYRDVDNPIPAEAWTTRRARDIFCFIASSPHNQAKKDIVIEEFWRDEDPKTIEKNFHPTISHLRKALNSKQAFKQKFILFREGSYKLNPELSYSIDTEEFENFIMAAEKAKKAKDNGRFRENLEKANELYRGEFMSGVYDDWAEDRRNYLEEQHLRILTALSKISYNEQKWAKASKHIKQILKKDPFREDMQRLQLKVLSAQGKRGAIREHFEHFEKLLKDELGVAPAPETVDVYNELLN